MSVQDNANETRTEYNTIATVELPTSGPEEEHGEFRRLEATERVVNGDVENLFASFVRGYVKSFDLPTGGKETDEKINVNATLGSPKYFDDLIGALEQLQQVEPDVEEIVNEQPNEYDRRVAQEFMIGSNEDIKNARSAQNLSYKRVAKYVMGDKDDASVATAFETGDVHLVRREQFSEDNWALLDEKHKVQRDGTEFFPNRNKEQNETQAFIGNPVHVEQFIEGLRALKASL